MSVDVELSELADAAAEFRFAYLLSVGDDDRAHVVAVQPILEASRLRVADLGSRSRANAAARPGVTLLWPPPDIDGYSLIVDGHGELAGDGLVVSPTRAVLHRPGPTPAPDSPCRADCIELPVTGAERES